MIKLSNISKAYDAPVLRNFSYEFRDRGLYLIKGPSGSGKTTLLRILAGLEKADEGSVSGLEGKKISMVFQDNRLIPFATVKENLLLVKEQNAENLQEAEEILASLGLADAMNKYPGELSGGMKGRCAVARSLYYGGEVYLWDEPTKELNESDKAFILKAIAELSKDRLVVVVTHDPSVIGGAEILL